MRGFTGTKRSPSCSRSVSYGTRLPPGRSSRNSPSKRGQKLKTEPGPSRSLVHRLLVDYQRAAPLAIFFLILLFTVLGVASIERGESEKDKAQLTRVALSAASALERRASVNASYLRAGSALFALQPDVDEALFRRFVTELRLDTDYRGAEGIGWAPLWTVSADGKYASTLTQTAPVPANLRPTLAEQPRSIIAPIVYIQPDTIRNRRAIGFDMYSEPVRRAAMDEAQKSVRPTASGKVVLVQEGETDGEPGFLIYMPVFSEDGGERRLRGFLYSPYNAGDFLASASELFELEGMQLSLYDGPSKSGDLLATVNSEAPDEGMGVEQELRLANRVMTVRVTSLRTNSLSLMSMLTLVFGIAFASLLMVIARLLTQQFVEDQRALSWFSEQNSIRNSLTRELNHRVKNTLANVLSIATLTRRRANSLDEYADALDGRIRALSATHDLLTQSDWGTTPIASVVAAELAPYTRPEDGVLAIDGPMVELAPNDALSLGLALHELATNASKYGALSVSGGRVSVKWRMIAEDLAQVDWAEHGGPQVSAKRPRGFGTDLIEKIVAHELRHPVDLDFAEEGVRCSLRVPVREPSDFALRSRYRPAS